MHTAVSVQVFALVRPPYDSLAGQVQIIEHLPHNNIPNDCTWAKHETRGSIQPSFT